MMSGMWQLYHATDAGDWIYVAICDGFLAVVQRIFETEALPVQGLLFEFTVSADTPTDDEVRAHLEYEDRHSAYVAKRLRH